VAGQRADDASLLHLVRRLIALRRAHPELGAGTPVEVLHDGFPFAYRRGPFTVAVNPRRESADLRLESDPGPLELGSGVRLAAGTLTVDGFGYAIYRS
jgi:maltose alpha-D-glucosyltransferase/alpha-amylase